MNPPEKTALTRLSHKGVEDWTTACRIIDGQTVGTFSWIREDYPMALPIAYVREGSSLLIHGSTGGGMLRELSKGIKATFCVTQLHGYVLARSAFESSMHYSSLVAFGTCDVVEGDEKVAAMQAVTEGLFPGRWQELRPMTSKEVAATLILRFIIEDWSAKISLGEPEDPEADLQWPVWAGVVPITTEFGEPRAASNLRVSAPVPSYISTWKLGEIPS